jgi:hypothetical protein
VILNLWTDSCAKVVILPLEMVCIQFMVSKDEGLIFICFKGTGGESIYGEKFNDEAFTVKHTRPFLLSMVSLVFPFMQLCPDSLS